MTDQLDRIREELIRSRMAALSWQHPSFRADALRDIATAQVDATYPALAMNQTPAVCPRCGTKCQNCNKEAK